MEQGVMGNMWIIYTLIIVMICAVLFCAIWAYKEDFKNCWKELKGWFRKE